MKGLVVILLVVAALIGGILTLRSTRRTGMPDQQVLDRAKARAKEEEAKDDSEANR